MTAKAGQKRASASDDDGTEFIATLGGGDAPWSRRSLGRLVLDGQAASYPRWKVDVGRAVLLAAMAELRARDASAGILVTPAGFVIRTLSGPYSGTHGWRTRQPDFDIFAATAADIVRELVSPDVRAAAAGHVDHLVVGVDLYHPDHGPYAETATLYDVAADAVRPITGKTYPNTGQQDDLIRDPDPASHVVAVGDERLAVLVCHDLAAWSPRGNAVATGVRQEAWEAMQGAVRDARPTLAVQLPHTVDTPRTWAPAWSRFAERAGGDLRSATSALRHLHKGEVPVEAPVPVPLLARTGRGEPALDIVVAGVGEPLR